MDSHSIIKAYMSCTFIETFELLKRADNLIRLKATGNPASFAEKMSISERSLYLLLQHLKEIGAPIAYNRARKSYYYTQPVMLKLGFDDLEVKKNNKG